MALPSPPGIMHDYADFTVAEMMFYIIYLSLKEPWNQPLSPDSHTSRMLAEQQRYGTYIVTKPSIGEAQNQLQQVASGTRNENQGCSGQLGKKRAKTSSAQEQPAEYPTVDGYRLYTGSELKLQHASLGDGEHGTVWLGSLLGSPVAVKLAFVRNGFSDWVQQLQHEATVYERLSKLQGVHVPRLLDAGYWRDEKQFFLATTVIEGKHPEDLDSDPKILAATKKALAAIHACGVAHKDIRNSNILVRKTSRSTKVFFIDFGHAVLDTEADSYESEWIGLQELFDGI